MSKKKSSKHSAPSAVRREEPGAGEAPKRSREIASFYTDDMSKEAVGGLYKDFAESGEPDGEGGDISEKTAGTGAETEDDYIKYMQSISKTSSKRSEAKSGKAEKESTPKSGTRRTTSVSLSSRDGGRTSAMLRHEKAEPEEESDGDERDSEEGSPFAALVLANLRYIIVGMFVVLLIFSVYLILTVNSLNSKLKAAGDPVAANTELRDQYNTLLIASEGKDTEISELRQEVARLTEELAAVPVQTEPPTTAPPTQTEPPATPKPGETNVPSGTTYTVEEGDTPWSIASKFYGNGSYYTKILEANGLSENAVLKIGTKLIIPQ